MTLRKLNGAGATPRLRRLDKWLLMLWLASSTLVGCAWLGKDLASGAVEGAGPKVSGLTHDAAAGARDALAEPETQQALLNLEKAVLDGAREGAIGPETQRKLQQLIDASFATLKVNATETRDSLLGDGLTKDVGRLRDEALGAKTAGELHQLKDELLGDDTNARVKALVNGTLNDETLDRVREHLVGAPLDKSVNDLITHAAATLKKQLPGVMNSVFPQLNDELKTAENRVFGLLVGLAIVIGLVVALVAVALYYLRKHRRIIRVITKKVEERADKPLKDSIKKAADEAGVEEYLHMLLEKNGIPVKHPPATAARNGQ